MYYADEIRQPESVNGKARLQKAEVEMAKQGKKAKRTAKKAS